MADQPLIALRVVRVVNCPPDALDQLSGVVFSSQLRGCDALVKGDSRLTLGGWLAHHDDSRHDRVPSGRWTPWVPPGAGQGVDGDLRLSIKLPGRAPRRRSVPSGFCAPRKALEPRLRCPEGRPSWFA